MPKQARILAGGVRDCSRKRDIESIRTKHASRIYNKTNSLLFISLSNKNKIDKMKLYEDIMWKSSRIADSKISMPGDEKIYTELVTPDLVI